MDQIIKARDVKVGNLVRFCLRGYFFNNDPKWREHCERTLRVAEINPSYEEGMLEFCFDDEVGTYRNIDPDTEVILVNNPVTQ